MKIKDIETNKRKIVIIGKNGSGKSMTLAELNKQTSNSIFIPSARNVHSLNTNLQEIQTLENSVKTYIDRRGFVGQIDTLFISKMYSAPQISDHQFNF